MALPPEILSGTAELRARIGAWRREGARVALVATMGALHDGHLALCRIGLHEAERLVVSIFVNPKQFAPHEDLANYPRPFAADVRLLTSVGAHAVFAPALDAMYKEGFATSVRVGGPLGADLEASARPHHFEGVATVVSKLLLQVQPDLAVFGEKDYQQLLMVRRLVRDLDLPVAIRAGATVREADGLALSSRNRYLSPHERRIAPRLHQTLQAAAFALKDGAMAEEACAAARATLEQCGFAVDYVELRDAETLAPVADAERPARLLAAVRLGATRLIDNVAVEFR
jgi:pantoate--beta-alanine ligase